jgi:hypothetical protein
MQCYNEAGKLVDDFRVGFVFDETNSKIVRRVALVEGKLVDLGRRPISDYVEKINDPFWINDSDHLYINSGFEYADELLRRVTARIMAHGQPQLEVIEIDPLRLSAYGLQLSAKQMRSFQDGQPIWRRSAFSCNPGQGKNGKSSTTSRRLRDALLSWVVFCDLVADHTLDVEKTNEDSKFFNREEGTLPDCARLVTERALEGKLSAPRLGLKAILFGKPAAKPRIKGVHRINAAHQHGRTIYFKRLFSIPRGRLSKLIKKEMTEFKNCGGPFDGEFDADAVIAWHCNIIAYLRVALAASSDFDAKRSSVRRRLMKEERQEERERIVQEFRVEWIKWVRGVGADGKTQREVALEDLFDLQCAVCIAFAAGVNPQVLFPYINRGIDDDEGRLLTSMLFDAAVWLGELFRRRYLQMDRCQASYIVALCNPDTFPSEVPFDRSKEWIAATRMITSFLTEKGLQQLLDGANAILNDGKTRSVFAVEPARMRIPKTPGMLPTVRQFPSYHIQIGETALPPPPIVVEAGWLTLPGDYQEAWVGQCNPFEPDFFPELYPAD